VRSHNPVLTRQDTWRAPDAELLEQMYATPQRMTIDDVVVKTGIMLGLLVTTAAATWLLELWPLVFPAFVVAIVCYIVMIFKKKPSPALCLTYAAAEGVVIGAISAIFEQAYPGIVLQAVGGTILCFGSVLVLYKTGKLRATPMFRKVIMSAMVGIVALYAVNLVMMLFGGHMPVINDSTPLGILFSVAVVSVAALSFVLDFDLIERAEAQGVPENVSWTVAFGLVVGLVWLYIEMLKLLAKLRDN
jgi:uncharacterized YccA/Bax inhibitor family protein